MSTLSNLRSTVNNSNLKNSVVTAAIIMAVMITAVTVVIMVSIDFGFQGAGSLGGQSAALVGDLIGSLPGISSKTPWHLSRSAGTVAYLLLLGSTVWGLLLSSKIIKEAVPATLALAMHNILSWLALDFSGLHALALLFDSYYDYSLFDLTIPFIGPYRPGWVGLGILGFYLMVLVTLSFQFRKQIGQKRWRKLHYLSFALFILVTVHGIAAGTDSSKSSMQLIYLGSWLLVFFLTSYRLLTRNLVRAVR